MDAHYDAVAGLALDVLNTSETVHQYVEIFEERVYFRHGIRLGKAPVVVDAGANIGMFAMYVGTTYADALLCCIEPAPPAVAKLRANLRRFGGRSRVLECALSDRVGTDTITVYPQFSTLSGLSRFADPEKERRRIKRRYEGEHAAQAGGTDDLLEQLDAILDVRFEAEKRPCRTETLSSSFRFFGITTVDLLKIDIQGAERLALDGIADADWELIRQIVLEVHDLRDVEAVTGRLENHFASVVSDVAPCGERALVYARKT